MINGIAMKHWMISRYKVHDVYGGFYDILAFLVQINLDVIFLLGSILLSLQVMWRKLFRTSQHEITNRDIFRPSEDSDEFRNFTIRELRQYDGVQDKRRYLAVNGKVFDATNKMDIQLLDGPLYLLAGKDASRALATFSFNAQWDDLTEMDDLSDLNPLQLDSLFHWEMQYSERYPCVGRLVTSHQPRALQHVCIRTICATMGELNGPRRKEAVDELPLPKLFREQIISSG